MAGRIGVRDLKNRASEIVREVHEHEAEYIVTLRGKPVAMLRPLSEKSERTLRQAEREEALAKLDDLADQVGVRELRQNLSQYLRRVAAGERFEVTERNLPVAVLAPLPGRSSALERLLADGRVVPARLDLAELGPPAEHDMTLSEALAEQRREG